MFIAADLFGIKDIVQFLGFFCTVIGGVWYLARTFGKNEVQLESLNAKTSQLVEKTAGIEKVLTDTVKEQHHLDKRVTILEDRRHPSFEERRPT